MKLYTYATYPYESVIFAFAPDKETAYKLIVDKYVSEYEHANGKAEEVSILEIIEHEIPTEPMVFVEAH